METIENLVREAAQGNLQAYNALVERLQDPVVAYAYSILGDFHGAQDVAQEAFVEAFFTLPSLRNPAAFVAWLKRIVWKHCDRTWRKKKLDFVHNEVDEIAEDDLKSPLQQLSEKENAAQIRLALNELSPVQREVVLLFYLSQLSHQEIAAFLALPVSTVKKRLHDARQKLKEKMIILMTEEFSTQRPSNDQAFCLQVQTFLASFSRLINKGESLVRSLHFLAEQEENTELQSAILSIQNDLMAKNGTLSSAMEKFPRLFSPHQINLIRRGELDGNLQQVLNQLNHANL